MVPRFSQILRETRNHLLFYFSYFPRFSETLRELSFFSCSKLLYSMPCRKTISQMRPYSGDSWQPSTIIESRPCNQLHVWWLEPSKKILSWYNPVMFWWFFNFLSLSLIEGFLFFRHYCSMGELRATVLPMMCVEEKHTSVTLTKFLVEKAGTHSKSEVWRQIMHLRWLRWGYRHLCFGRRVSHMS
jgi:hypothetical protein